MVRILEVESLAGWGPAWDDLTVLASPPSPFLRSWWLDAVAARTARPLVLLVLDDHRLVGGLALALDRWAGVARVRLLGSGALCPDHLDAVADPAYREEVGRVLASWLRARPRTLVELSGLPEGSLLADALGAEAEQVDVAPFGPVPPEAAGRDYVATRSRNTRSSVRRSQRRLSATGHEHRRVGATELDGAVAWFEQLSGDRDGREPLLGELPTLRDALAAGLPRGEAAVDVLQHHHGGLPLALVVSFRVASTVSLYQVARSVDPEADGAGTALLGHVLDRAVAEGATEVDLLRGAEDYKSSWVDRTRTLWRVRTARGLLPRLLLGALAVRRRAVAVSATRRSPAGPAPA